MKNFLLNVLSWTAILQSRVSADEAFNQALYFFTLTNGKLQNIKFELILLIKFLESGVWLIKNLTKSTTHFQSAMFYLRLFSFLFSIFLFLIIYLSIYLSIYHSLFISIYQTVGITSLAFQNNTSNSLSVAWPK